MRLISFFLLLCSLTGCVSQPLNEDVLRVGISPNNPPFAFKENGVLKGIEVDYARRLSTELGYEPCFVELAPDKLIESLINHKIDTIMSGTPVTQRCIEKISFSIPYLNSGLSGLFRRNSCDPENLMNSILMNQNKNIGIIKNTPAADFVRIRFPGRNIREYATVETALKALRKGRIDIFIHDAPVLWWAASKYSDELVSPPQILNNQLFAWGFRKEDALLRNAVNKLVIQWKTDGTIKRIINTWIPNIFEQPVSKP